jgi:hypothetical protein
MIDTQAWYLGLRDRSRADHSFFARLAREKNLKQLLNAPERVDAEEIFVDSSASNAGAVIYDGVTKQVIVVNDGTLTIHAMNGTSSTFKLHVVPCCLPNADGVALNSNKLVIDQRANHGSRSHAC